MIVISDTSCLNYLVLIDEITILYHLYRQVIIPPAVREELLRPQTPETVREWISDAPDWVKIIAVTEVMELGDLGAGEQEAISLALEIDADIVLMDDYLARMEAEKHGLIVTGILGVLKDAAKANLLSLEEAFEKLKRTTFRVSASLLGSILEAEKASQS